MPQSAEYKAISAQNPVELTRQLTIEAAQGWHPILMSSGALPAVVITTVILEHKIGS